MRARILIVDDERLSRTALRAQLAARDDIVIIGECADGRTALTTIERERPDVVFLDIQMPHLNGMQLLERLDREGPAVVLVTAYDEHAVRAFELQAVDYLLKPFDAARLNAALDRALARRREHALYARVESTFGADTATGERRYAQRLLVPDGGRARFIAIREIDWVQAEGSRVRLHVGESIHLMSASIGELEPKLDPVQFMRIHRSTIVNLDRIAHVEPYGGSDYQVVLHNGRRLRVSRGSRDRLLKGTL